LQRPSFKKEYGSFKVLALLHHAVTQRSLLRTTLRVPPQKNALQHKLRKKAEAGTTLYSRSTFSRWPERHHCQAERKTKVAFGSLKQIVLFLSFLSEITSE